MEIHDGLMEEAMVQLGEQQVAQVVWAQSAVWSLARMGGMTPTQGAQTLT
ncbi:hypothetical protein [Magnetococcus sp. PR-3]